MARPKMDKTDYLIPEGGLIDWPSDWDKTQHKPLKPEDFAGTSEHIYWQRKAKDYQEKVDYANQQAELCQKFGSRDERKTASQALRKMEQAREMLAQLEAAGISAADLEALQQLKG